MCYIKAREVDYDTKANVFLKLSKNFGWSSSNGNTYSTMQDVWTIAEIELGTESSSAEAIAYEGGNTEKVSMEGAE